MRRGSVVALLITLVIAIVASQGMRPEHKGPGCHATCRAAGRRSRGCVVRDTGVRNNRGLAPGTANLVLGRIRLAPERRSP